MLTRDQQCQGRGCLAELGCGVDKSSDPRPGSGSQSRWCAGPGDLSVPWHPRLCPWLSHTVPIASVPHGPHRVCVGILCSSAVSGAAASWGPVCPFPGARLSRRERGTRCQVWGHGDPGVPKGHRQPPPVPLGAPGGPPPLLRVTYGQTNPPE